MQHSVLTKHDIYRVVWTAIIKELHLEAEVGYQHDKYAVAVTKNAQIVGHVSLYFPSFVMLLKEWR